MKYFTMMAALVASASVWGQDALFRSPEFFRQESVLVGKAMGFTDAQMADPGRKATADLIVAQCMGQSNLNVQRLRNCESAEASAYVRVALRAEFGADFQGQRFDVIHGCSKSDSWVFFENCMREGLQIVGSAR